MVSIPHNIALDELESILPGKWEIKVGAALSEPIRRRTKRVADRVVKESAHRLFDNRRDEIPNSIAKLVYFEPVLYLSYNTLHQIID